MSNLLNDATLDFWNMQQMQAATLGCKIEFDDLGTKLVGILKPSKPESGRIFGLDFVPDPDQAIGDRIPVDDYFIEHSKVCICEHNSKILEKLKNMLALDQTSAN
jgi:hypothetical protein